MITCFAMILSLGLGGGAPLDGAARSLRQESLALAARVEPQRAPMLEGPLPAERTSERPGLRRLTDRDWRNLVGEALRNESVANAVMWLATQPLHVTVAPEKVFLSVRIATP